MICLDTKIQVTKVYSVLFPCDANDIERWNRLFLFLLNSPIINAFEFYLTPCYIHMKQRIKYIAKHNNIIFRNFVLRVIIFQL